MTRLNKLMMATFLAAGLGINSANATLLTFGEISIPLPGIAIPNGYGGLNWDKFRAIDAALADPGYLNAVVSAPNVAYINIGVPASISNSGGFNLISGFFTAPYDFDPTEVHVTTTGGMNPTKSFSINTTGPTEVIFNFYNITSATFSTSPSASTNFALDNLTVETVPIPPTTWLFGSALLGLIGVARRKNA